MPLQLVLVCGGRGTRFPGRPGGVPKACLPLHGEPLARRLLRQLGPRCTGDSVAVAAAGDPHVPALFAGRARVVVQAEPDGVAAAIALALPYLEGDALVALGDVVIDGSFASDGPAPALVVWRDAPPEVTARNFGVRERPLGVVEKPREPGLVCGLGLYLLTREVIAGFATCPPDARGERAITDALAHSIAAGTRYRLVDFAGRYVNVNTAEDLALAEELFA